MIKVVAKNYIKKNKIDEVLQYANELVSLTRKEEGCILYEMYQDEQDETILTMIEEWDNIDVLNHHMVSEHFKRIVPMIGECSEKPGDINIYKKVL